MLGAEDAARRPPRVDVRELVEVRSRRPEAIAEAAAARNRRPLLGSSGRLLIVAADHPARGSLAAGGDPLAMADRAALLERLVTALSRPGVDGVLGTADVLEDLLLLGALERKVVLGSMNRGGLAGAAFELDDRFTGHRAEDLAALRFDGGKLLLRIDHRDPGTGRTLHAAARTVDALASLRLPVFVEPFLVGRTAAGVRADLRSTAVARSVAIAAGLGGTSAYTWLKLPVPADGEAARAYAAATLPMVVLGGEAHGDLSRTYERWREALRLPTVRGLVAGRPLLYPAAGAGLEAVASAVDRAAELVHG